MSEHDPLGNSGFSGIDVPFGAYERHLLKNFVLELIERRIKHGRVKASESFLDWYNLFSREIGLDIPELNAAAKNHSRGRTLAPEQWIRIAASSLKRAPGRMPKPSALQERLDWISRTLDLDPIHARVLGFICRMTLLPTHRQFVAAITGSGAFEKDEITAIFVMSALGITRSKAARILSPHALMVQLGLIEDRRGGDYAPSEMLVRILNEPTTDPEVLEDLLIGDRADPGLEMEDFHHLGQAGQDVVDLVNGALKTRAAGISLLFYGPPGTGKTEFAKLLSEACQARVVFAGELDDDAMEPSRADRIAHLSLLSALGSKMGRMIVVVDEADDLLSGVDHEQLINRMGSKVFVNRVVERSPAPTIWITNNPQRFGTAVIRRMTHALEFRKPGRAVRRRIAERLAAAHGLTFNKADLDALAVIEAAPAVIAAGLRNAALGKGGVRAAIDASVSIARAMGHNQPTSTLVRSNTVFDASLSSADTDLKRLERQVTAAGQTMMSFLFTGLPGTGKSAYARHLAACLGMDVLEKRASDLLGKYVGDTEANIAAAFREAVEGRQFLIFDEADSLLSDRSLAHANWEVGQVNEMLTWMESHPLPFAATSNLLDRLDPAVQRRFVFKARFEAMNRQQIDTAFNRHFGMAAPESVLRLTMLTPGDFEVVARRARILGSQSREEIGEMLGAEVAMKRDAPKPIGFL